jgi:hypothetical protein
MFRPYNLTSIAAWTVGSLAGNKAYYETKAKNSGLKFSRARGNPGYVEKLHGKFVNIDEQVASLHDDLGLVNEGPCTFNATPLIKFLAYSNWLDSNKDRIKNEVSITFERATSAGYIYPPNLIQKIHSDVESSAEAVDSTSKNIMQQLNEQLAQEPTKDKIFECINQKVASMEVDEKSWKLKFSEDGLKLCGANPNPKTVVPEAPKKRANYAKPKPRFHKVKAIVAPQKTDFQKKLYIARGEEILGPYKYSLLLTWLENGNASKDDLVAYDGAPKWVKLKQLIAEVNSSP